MEWSFNYTGPRLPAPDPRCTTCRSKQTAECPTHVKGYAQGCAHCGAAQGGECHAHWGLEAALDACPISEESKSDFGLARSLILSEPLIEKAARVSINVRSSRIAGVREMALFIRPI